MLLGVSSQLEHSSPQEWVSSHKALGLKCVNFPVSCTDGEDKFMAYKRARPKHTKFCIESMPWMIPSSPDEYVLERLGL